MAGVLGGAFLVLALGGIGPAAPLRPQVHAAPLGHNRFSPHAAETNPDTPTATQETGIAETAPGETLAETPTATPTDTLEPAPTATATPTFTGTPPPSPTDTSVPTATPTATDTPIATETATGTATETATNTPTDTPAATATLTPLPLPPPRLWISELMADPEAVQEPAGEWLELYNADAQPVNLYSWTLTSGPDASFTILTDLWLPPGGYLVLAYSDNAGENGGIVPAYAYSKLYLPNANGSLTLYAPDGQEVDRVDWGTPSDSAAVSQAIIAGASLERTSFARPGVWVPAHAVWPGSWGDRGSPGMGYLPPTLTPTATPLPSPTATVTPPPASPPALYLSEFLADPAAVHDDQGEWLEIANADSIAVNLNGWSLADLDGDWHTIRADLWLQPGDYAVLARHGDAAANGGVAARYVYDRLTLVNEADELRLLAPWGVDVDRVDWGPSSPAGLRISAGVSLERADRASPAAWMPAWRAWLGSAGDWGSPGQPYAPAPPDTPTSTWTPVPLSTPTPTSTGASTPTSTPPSTATTTPVTATPPPAPARLRISELMADPAAAPDETGEWLEIVNLETAAVNLNGWTLADLGRDRHVIEVDFWIAPGQYAVLARNGDSAVNGGAPVAYVYAGLQLANGADELLLRTPWGVEVDRVVWEDTTAGASLERTSLDTPGAWTTAHAPWPGSAGDWGSPGQPYTPAPPDAAPTPSPTAALLPTTTPSPTLPTSEEASLLLTEIMADPAAAADQTGEWLEIANTGDADANLRGWALADLDGDRHQIETDLWIAPGQYLVLARSGDPAANGGIVPHYVYRGLQLANEADEVLLISPWGVEIDRVVWDASAALGVAAVDVHSGASVERTSPSPDAPWTAAHSPWLGSAGDLGSPGLPYTPPPAPTAMPTAPAGPWPRLLISEFLADPEAAGDEYGEWIEIANPGVEPVDLQGWAIADLDGDHHLIAAPLMAAPGQYVVLGRSSDLAANGGAPVAYVYTGLQLANDADELILLAPDGSEVDRVLWPDSETAAGARIEAGASLERTRLDEAPQWAIAYSAWPGSAGDLGSPGQPYTLPPAAMPTATVVVPRPTPVAPLPTPVVPLPTPVAPPLTPVGPTAWSIPTAPGPLLIEEVQYHGSDGEFIALLNSGAAPVALRGWSLGDAELPGKREGLYALPDDSLLAPGALLVIARDGAAFRAAWGHVPDAELEGTDVSVPDLARRSSLANGRLALDDSGDEVVLVDPAGELADAVAYGDANYAALHVSGSLRAPTGFSLHAVPGARFPQTAELRHRLLLAPPAPFTAHGLPLAQAGQRPALDGGLMALWGSLGSYSTFSDGGTAPPHYLLAAAGAAGLDFLAIADSRPIQPVAAAAGASAVAPINSWRWQSADGDAQAILYTQSAASLATWADVTAFLALGGMAQAQTALLAAPRGVAAFAADDAFAPGGLTPLYKAWAAAQAPLLPAGNANPPLPGVVNPTPRYTGLAATEGTTAGVLAALAAHRGWLTSAPGLWLTLHSEDGVWMGSFVAPANEIVLHIDYGDRSGEVAGLALWQDGSPVRQLDTPPVDGRWSLALPAVPGALLYAVATQLDGDFAVTAPLSVQPADGGSIQINEVVPAPAADYNGDGQESSDDEFIELYNAGDTPLALAGWQLGDDAASGRRFTFGPGRSIGGHDWLALYRSESRLALDDDGDRVRLFNADGVEIDQIVWTDDLERGRSLSRVPDGGAWMEVEQATPGRANAGAGGKPHAIGGPGGQPSPGDDPDHDGDDDGEEEGMLPATYGQASGPPGSLAAAKLRGLEAQVEFRAQVVTPPGLFNAAIYVAEPALLFDGVPTGLAGLGIQVYLNRGDFPPLQEGDWVLVRGQTRSFRGEMEVTLDAPEQVWRIEAGTPLQPLPVQLVEIGESLEGRLVTFIGVISGWQGDSLYLIDPQAGPDAAPVRVTVRSSLDWKRPYVQKGQVYQVVGVVSQFARAHPWNGGYRILVRYKTDLVRVD
jgi:hypothetical protein